MAQLIQHCTSAAKALELKMWNNGHRYVIYLGGLPLNIKTGYATTGSDYCDDEYTTENNVSHTELCKNYFEAMKRFEEMRQRYLE